MFLSSDASYEGQKGAKNSDYLMGLLEIPLLESDCKLLHTKIKEMPMKILENVLSVLNNLKMEMSVQSHIQHSSS